MKCLKQSLFVLVLVLLLGFSSGLVLAEESGEEWSLLSPEEIEEILDLLDQNDQQIQELETDLIRWQTMFLEWAPKFEKLPETLMDLSNRQNRYEEETAAYETSLEEAVKEQQIKGRINTALGVGGGVILGILIKIGIDWVRDG